MNQPTHIIRDIKLTLTFKAALITLVISAIGVIGIAVLMFIDAQAVLQKQALERLADDVQRESTVLTKNLITIKHDVLLFSQLDAVKGFVRAIDNNGYDEQENMTETLWFNRLRTLFKTTLQGRSEYFQIRFIGLPDEGRELVRVEKNKDQIESITNEKLQVKKSHDYWIETIALAPGQVRFSKVDLNKEHGHISYPPTPVIRVSTPVFDQVGKAFGVIIINAYLNKIAGNFEQPPPNIYYFLSNHDGDFLIHPDEKKRLAFEFEKIESISKEFPGFSAKELSNTMPQALIVNNSLGGEVGLAVQKVEFNTDDYLFAGAVASLEVIEAESRNLLHRLFVILPIVLGFLTFLIAAIMRALTRPIQELTEISNRISKGDDNVVVPDYGKDEVGQLARSFNLMLTNWQRSKNDLSNLASSLEAQVNERTEELNEVAEAAHAASEAKSTFLAKMSHEIRTPMNGVLGMTELLLKSDLNSRQQMYVQTAHGSAQSLLHIINDILDFSKVEAGELVLEEIPFDLRSVVADVIQILANAAQRKDVELIYHVSSDVPYMLRGDPNRLRQILFNLISNSVKFTQQGEIVLFVKLLAQDTDDVELSFEVKDTGVGIAEELHGKLFDAFSQADESTTRKYGGTGLGLTIVKQLVEMMNGDIRVKSELDKGTTFVVTLKLLKSTERPKQEYNQFETLQNLKVLVVDDNKTNRYVIKEHSRNWGMQCDEAESVHEAIDKIANLQERGAFYDLLLIDYMMPDATGLDLARKIKAVEKTKNIPMILLSSMGDMKDDSLHELFACVTTKPIHQSDLFNCIHSVLGPPRVHTRLLRSKELEDTDTLPVSVSKANILIVEDNETNQIVIESLLNQLGYQVEFAWNGEQAISLFCENRYDIIFMDCEMPVMDGFTATKEIRAIEATRQVDQPRPIIALTANAVVGDRERCIDAGMTDYLSKPVNQRQLNSMLEKYLSAELQLSITGEKTSVINYDVFDRLKDDMGNKFQELLDSYVGNLDKSAKNMRTSKNECNTEELARIAHTVKSNSAMFGAEHLSRMCTELEIIARAGEVEAADKLITDIANEVALFIQEVKN